MKIDSIKLWVYLLYGNAWAHWKVGGLIKRRRDGKKNSSTKSFIHLYNNYALFFRVTHFAWNALWKERSDVHFQQVEHVFSGPYAFVVCILSAFPSQSPLFSPPSLGDGGLVINDR